MQVIVVIKSPVIDLLLVSELTQSGQQLTIFGDSGPVFSCYTRSWSQAGRNPCVGLLVQGDELLIASEFILTNDQSAAFAISPVLHITTQGLLVVVKFVTEHQRYGIVLGFNPNLVRCYFIVSHVEHTAFTDRNGFIATVKDTVVLEISKAAH